MAEGMRARRGLTPGEIYKGIPVSKAEFEEGEEKALVKRARHPFVRYCKRLHRMYPGLGRGTVFQEKYRDAIEFLDWDLKAEEFSAAIRLTLVFSLAAFVVIAFVIDSSPASQIIQGFLQNNQLLAKAYIYLPFILASLALTYYVQNYPLGEVKIEQTRALTYVPEIMGYMIMSMKLVPNLEKSVEFAAEHGRGKVAEDFKKIIWEVQLGTYSTLSEALDRLAYRWGKYSEEFKHALMMIRASVLENTEAKRYQLLDKTMATVLDSIKNKMEDYARKLQEPGMILFYVGVLLPLMLIIILPIGSAFTGQPMAMPPVLVLIYNIAIPVGVVLFARRVIKGRPPTYDPPRIPDNYPGLPKKGYMIVGKSQLPIVFVVAGILVLGIVFSLFLSQEGFPPKSIVGKEFPQFIPYDKAKAEVFAKIGRTETYYDDSGEFKQELISRRGLKEREASELLILERERFYSQRGNDITPYALVFGLMLTVSLCLYVLLYHSFIYKRKVQLEIMKLESEFKDSLYILASRLGENKPVEEALRHTRDFLPDLAVSERIFGRTIENIELLGMPLEAAVFDPMYGSLKNIPSNIIQGSMRLLIDSVQLGVNLAARTLISLSLQLSNSEKVSRMLSVLVSDIISMTRTLALFIAPIVLGITVGLQKVIIGYLLGVAGSSLARRVPGGIEQAALTQAGIELPTLTGIDVSIIPSLVTPLQFLIIVAVYAIELVLVMGYFNTKIQEDNNVLVWVSIAKALPVAMTIFILSVISANALIGGSLG